MKVRFKHNIGSITGKMDNEIYYYNRKLKQTICRCYTQPKSNPMAEKYRRIMSNLKLIKPSLGYIRNIKDYMILYNDLPVNMSKPAIVWMNIYLKMLFVMSKKIPGIDLESLTREQIYLQELPCLCLKNAIEAGLLPPVRNYIGFTRGI